MPPPELGIDYQDLQLYTPPPLRHAPFPTPIPFVSEAEKILGSRLRKTPRQTSTGERKTKGHREPKTQVPFDQDKRGYVALDFGTPHTLEMEGEGVEGILYTTRNHQDWFLAFPDVERIPTVTTPFHLNGAGAELGRRQKPERADDKNGKDHERNLLFFDANWELLAPLFFDLDIPLNTRLQRFREVDLNDYALERDGQEGMDSKKLLKCGVVDFVGVAPDGQVLVVEFSDTEKRKSRQLAKQTKGLKEVIRDKNHGLVPNIVPYIGVYNDKTDPFIITFETPDPDYFPERYVSPHPEVVLFDRQISRVMR